MQLTKTYVFLSLTAMLLLLACNKEEDAIPTTITASNFTVTIEEKPTTGTVLGKIAASSNKASISFKLKSQTVSNAFALNSSSGEISISNADVFTFATNPTMSAVVTITSEEATKDVSLTVTLSQEPISIISSDFSLTINEKRSIGTVLGSIQATTNRGTLSYSIKSQSREGAFALNPTSGSLTVSDASKWFYHLNETLTAVITVANGPVNEDIDVQVTLSDLPPILSLTGKTITIPENPDPWNHLLAFSSDEGEEDVVFSILSQTYNDAFSIYSPEGIISFNNLDHFNYENNTQLEATVQVTQRGTTTSANVVVNLTDVLLHKNEGLTAYYPFENSVSDQSGNNRAGTGSGTLTFATDRFGQTNKALQFSGGHIIVQPFGDNQNQFTIGGWVLDDNTSTGYKTIVSKGGTNREYVMRVAALSNCNCINTHFASGGNSVSDPNVFPKNVWKHVLFTYNNGTTKLYVNGTEVSSRSMTPINWQNGTIRIGGISGSSEVFRGKLDDFVFFNRVITQGEITTLATDFND